MGVVDGLVKRSLRGVAKKAAGTEAKVAARGLAEREARMVGDRLVKGGAKQAAASTQRVATEELTEGAFEATLASVKAKLKRDGAFFDAAKPLHEAVRQASTTDEALKVARLAQELAIKHNKANAGAAVAAMDAAIQKASLLPEAQAALKQVVLARQTSYGLYSMAQKQNLTKAAVDRLLALAGPGDASLKLVLRGIQPAFGQDDAAQAVARLAKKETIEEQAAGLVSYLRKALN